jgi:hypothetical protein
MRRSVLFGLLLSSFVFCVPTLAQSHEKKEANLDQSGKPQAVSGGVKTQVSKPLADIYEKALNYLKKADYMIDSADKEAGQIVTSIVVTGGYHQTGTRIYVILIKDSELETTVRVAVTEQKRYKALQTEPWGDPKVNDKESQRISNELKATIQ